MSFLWVLVLASLCYSDVMSTIRHSIHGLMDLHRVRQTRFSSFVHTRNQATFKTAKGNLSWPYRDQVAVIEGNITLGGLMMVHERDEELICGKIMPQGGLQATEAMLYTVRWINEHQVIPGITLGARVKDDCDRDIYGLEQSVDFIRGSVTKLAGANEKCKENQPQMIAGVVAAPSSVTSIQVANLLKLFKIPQVSFFSTSPALSQEKRFPFFMRTIPSDNNQAAVMVEIVKLFNWTYVSVIYEESSYGRQGFSELEDLLKKEDICIAVTDKLIKDSGVASAAVYDSIIRRLDTKPDARGVIVFGSDQEVAALMRAVERANMTGYYTWIGSDGWGGRILVTEGNEAQVEGAITVQPYAEPVQGFEEYFLNLTPETNPDNPWFVEYWEDYFQCRVEGSRETPYNQNYTQICDTSDRMTLTNGYVPEAQLQFVSDAVMAFAVALKNMHEDNCGGVRNPGICPEMDPYDGQLLLKYLLNVSFTGLSGEQFQFLSNGDGIPRYRILHFRQTKPGKYEWLSVGQYNNRSLTMMIDSLQFTMNETNHPPSVCSKPCGPTEAQQFLTSDRCCWVCTPCTGFQYLVSQNECDMCPLGRIPSLDRKSCIDITEKYLHFDSPVAIVAMTVASAGVIATLYVIVVFFKYSDTPIVKASGRELSYVLLAGILLCYGMTFILVVRPNDVICGAQKFGIGYCFSVCYAALLTKTNRIARIFHAGKRTIKRPRFISPESQLIICGVLVGIQVIIGALWLLLSPPKAGNYFPHRDENQYVCLSAVGPSYMIGLAYPIVLIVTCTVYAVLTRKIPESFNESKYIGFTMYTTCIIWLAFVPIYFTTADKIEVRLAVMCFSISLSATVALVCLFTPKLCIILLHPERNVRQSMMTSKLQLSAKSSTANSSSVRIDSCTQSDACKLKQSQRSFHRTSADGTSPLLAPLPEQSPSKSTFKPACEIEMHQRLYATSSLSSCTNATQTGSNGCSISTQTLDIIERENYDDMDIQL